MAILLHFTTLHCLEGRSGFVRERQKHKNIHLVCMIGQNDGNIAPSSSVLLQWSMARFQF